MHIFVVLKTINNLSCLEYYLNVKPADHCRPILDQVGAQPSYPLKQLVAIVSDRSTKRKGPENVQNNFWLAQ